VRRFPKTKQKRFRPKGEGQIPDVQATLNLQGSLLLKINSVLPINQFNFDQAQLRKR